MRFLFKQRLASPKPQCGTFVFSPDPAITEIVGRSGSTSSSWTARHTTLGTT